MKIRDRYTNLVQKINMPDFCKFCDSFAVHEYQGRLLCEDHFNEACNKLLTFGLYGSLLKS